MNMRMRLELQGAVQQWVDSFMEQYNVPAYMMEDALSKELLVIKDKAITEFMIDIQEKQLATTDVENVEEV